LTLNDLNVRNVQESYHDAQQALETAITLFSAGYLPLEQRCQAESLYFQIVRKICKLVDDLDVVPDELEGLPRLLARTYFCNFSLFQSMPDSWAIKQLFPIMPIHRLDERPSQQAVLGDITCDSDGKIERFIDRRDIRRTLDVHPFDGSTPYYLGAFLVGAYQEILGDLHNLFGDTNAAHIDLDEEGQLIVQNIIRGDSVNEVLRYVQFNGRELINRLQTSVDEAIRQNRIDHRQAGDFVSFYEEALNGYTYLEEPGEG
jgi:arginine decarboxylase